MTKACCRWGQGVGQAPHWLPRYAGPSECTQSGSHKYTGEWPFLHWLLTTAVDRVLIFSGMLIFFEWVNKLNIQMMFGF